ncbi:MAG TPA: deoxyribose-phosphate aldolase [Leeuwenhoekiella sp.]|nr:deoxyribose-phosphate aldolase [Leeuwenhoekiella sp.]
MRKIFTVLTVLLFAAACQQEKETDPVETIINKAVQRAGKKVLDNATISFNFRDKFYKAKRENGNFALSRCSDNSCSDTLDVLSNTGFARSIKNKPVKLADSMTEKYSNSVNSVHYFAVLPYGLDNPAVNKELIDTVRIKGKSYYEVKVGFEKQGGGKDYEDHFMYWINTQDFTVGYMAYNYQVNEGGTRFREVYNPREINGVRVVDYRNYKPNEQYPPLQSLDSLFINDKLELLSTIALKNVAVKACPNC